MTASEMRQRVKLIDGEAIDELDHNEGNEETCVDNNDAVATDDEENEDSRMKKINDIIYNESDDEEQREMPEQSAKKKSEGNPVNKINIFDMIKDNNGTASKNAEENHFEINSEDIRGRLAELYDSDDDSEPEIYRHGVLVNKKHRKQTVVLDSDDIGIESTKESNPHETLSQDLMSSQAIRSRLATLIDSDDSDNERMSITNKKRKFSSSDEDSVKESHTLNTKKARATNKIIDSDSDE